LRSNALHVFLRSACFHGSGFRVQGSGFQVSGSWYRYVTHREVDADTETETPMLVRDGRMAGRGRGRWCEGVHAAKRALPRRQEGVRGAGVHEESRQAVGKCTTGASSRKGENQCEENASRTRDICQDQKERKGMVPGRMCQCAWRRQMRSCLWWFWWPNSL